MTEKRAIETEDAPLSDSPFSQAIQTGDFLYVSGVSPIDAGEEYREADVGAQTEAVMESIAAIVRKAEGSLDDVVKATVYLRDMDDYEAVNEAYGEFFGDVPPARVCVEVSRLPDDARVEIDAIARL